MNNNQSTKNNNEEALIKFITTRSSYRINNN